MNTSLLDAATDTTWVASSAPPPGPTLVTGIASGTSSVVSCSTMASNVGGSFTPSTVTVNVVVSTRAAAAASAARTVISALPAKSRAGVIVNSSPTTVTATSGSLLCAE